MAFEDGASGAGDGGADVGGVADLIGGAGGAGAAAAGGGGADGGAGAGAGGEGGGGAAPDWFEKLSAEAGEGDVPSNRDWAQAKGVKDLDGLVKIARDTEKAYRETGRIKVPGEGAKPEEVAAFKAAIGVPEKADDYEIKPIENGRFDPNKPESESNPKTIPLNEPLINSLRESALKHGAPKGAFEGLVGDFVKMQLDEAAAETKKQDDLAAGWLKEQGAKGDEMLAHVNAAARGLSLSSADMKGLRAGLGADRALALLSKLGSGMAEDTLMTGGKGRFGVTGAEAQAEMDRLKTDGEFQKKVRIAGSPERMRWDRLNAAAAEAKAREEERG